APEDSFTGLSLANGRINHIVTRRLRTVPWTVFCLVPTSSLEGPINALTATGLGGGGIIAAVALLLGLAFTVRILRPIRSLAAAANALREGNFSARATLETRDELGALAQSFNAMADALLSGREHLERKVRERT